MAKSIRTLCAEDALLGARFLAEYREMPGLCLTAGQAARLWAVGMDRCQLILDALVSEGLLRRAASGRYLAGGGV